MGGGPVSTPESRTRSPSRKSPSRRSSSRPPPTSPTPAPCCRKRSSGFRGGLPVGADLVDGVDEEVQQVRVEMSAPAGPHIREGGIPGKCGPVDPVAREGVVHVGDGGDPTLGGGVLAGQAVGVAAAVPALVVVQGDAGAELQER